jgi:acetoacetyl-CoA reductase
MVGQVPEPVKETILKRIPLGRLGRPAEIARCVRFLVEDGAYITGQAINPVARSTCDDSRCSCH